MRDFDNSLIMSNNYVFIFVLICDIGLCFVQVKFLLPSPEHTHVYSNGHICLNILYDEW